MSLSQLGEEIFCFHFVVFSRRKEKNRAPHYAEREK